MLSFFRKIRQTLKRSFCHHLLGDPKIEPNAFGFPAKVRKCIRKGCTYQESVKLQELKQ